MEPTEVTLQALGQVATSVGLSAGLILFFVWQAWKREERTVVEIGKREQMMAERESKVVARLQELENFTRTTLIDLARSTAVALNQNTIALNESSAIARVVVESLGKLDDDMRAHHKLVGEVSDKIAGGKEQQT